jgi:PEGA domain
MGPRVIARNAVAVTAIAVVFPGAMSLAFGQMNGQLNQTTRGAGAQRGQTVNRPALPAPPTTSPVPSGPPQTVAPPITYPFPPLMTPPAGGLLPRAGEGVPFNTRPPRAGYGGSYFYPPLGYADVTGAGDPSRSRPVAPVPTTGLLRVSATPLSAEVYVDGLYVGTVADINARNVLELTAGPHRLEIRAPQYEPITIDIRISPYETTTYRASLEPLRLTAAAPATSPSRQATTMYMIPNCYLGNVPPRQNRLPPGCDAKRVQVIAPK